MKIAEIANEQRHTNPCIFPLVTAHNQGGECRYKQALANEKDQLC